MVPRFFRLFFLNLGLIACLSLPIEASQFNVAVSAYYKQDYLGAKRALSTVGTLNPDQDELLSSLIDLKLGDVSSALTHFKRIDFSKLRLGRYETLVKLQFQVIDPSVTSAQLLKTLFQTQDQIGQNPMYSQFSLLVANRLLSEGNRSEAYPLFFSIAQGGGNSATTLEATKALLDIYIQQGQSERAVFWLKKLALSGLPVGELDTLLGRINKKFGFAFGFKTLLNSPSDFLQFFRLLYDRQDYSPCLRYGQQFCEAYPTHSGVAEVKTNMAMCYFLQGAYSEAISGFDTVISTYPGSKMAAKSLFYKARSLQKQKQYEAAKSVFLQVIESKNNDEYIGDAYYYLYWCFEELNDVAGFAALYDRFKHTINYSTNLDQLVWNLAWQMYQTGRTRAAYDLLRYHPLGLSSDDFKSRVLFWMGKMATQFDPEKAQFYFQKCLNRFPLSYHSYRIAQNHIPKPLSDVAKRLKSTNEQVDPYYLRMAHLGLADWVVADLTGQIREQRPKSRQLTYTLASIYASKNQPYDAIMTVARSGISTLVQGKISKEFMTLLYPRPYWEHIQVCCKKFGVDPFLALALMREESLFNYQARSKSGAMGLMQLMPETAMGISKALEMSWQGPEMVYAPEINILFGTHYLAYLKKRFNNNFALMLSGYNAGPNITQKWAVNFQDKDIEHFVAAIPYSETNGYVTRVLKSYWIYRLLYQN